MDDAPYQAMKKQAMLTSLRILAAAPKSRREISHRLQDKGYSERAIQDVLGELETQGLLNDRVFAETLASRLTHSKPSGSKKIEFELKRHQVPEKIREEILDQMTPEQERERAMELGQLRWDKFKNLAGDKKKKRVYDFLIRRGFDYQMVRDVIEELERH